MNDGAEKPPDEVVVPLEDQLDLHSFAPRDVRSVTEAYLEQALAAGLRRVRLIHGRGIGVQRDIVRAVLARHPAVVSYADAPDLRGGRGATVVELRAAGAFDAPAPLGDNGSEVPGDGG
jgi:dsDNA-specific endonuclease/ATPase MutS2